MFLAPNTVTLIFKLMVNIHIFPLIMFLWMRGREPHGYQNHLGNNLNLQLENHYFNSKMFEPFLQVCQCIN